MRPGLFAGPISYAAKKTPGLKRLPVLKLLAAADIALLARDHMARLDRQERRRLVELARIGSSRKRKLSDEERDELAELISKVEPRLLLGTAVDRMSPVPLPGRLVYGPRKRGPHPPAR